VAQGYNDLNAAVMAEIYGASVQSSFDVGQLEGTSPSGEGRYTADGNGPRVSWIKSYGLDHAWPAGEGPGGSYISNTGVSYPAHLTQFLFAENRRIGSGSGGSTDTTAPAAPTGLGVTGTSGKTVDLAWNANAESDLAGYNVYVSTTSGSGYSKANGSLVTSTGFQVSGLAASTTYYFVLTAVDASGNESAASAEVSATTASKKGGKPTR
jgi:poly(3-hydroxybutyrate) depolymerase